MADMQAKLHRAETSKVRLLGGYLLTITGGRWRCRTRC
jgi:hypothetical protein